MSSSPGSQPLSSPPRRHGVRRAFGTWVWILVFCAGALIATYMLFVEPPPPRRIVIASGGRNGAYFRFAQQYAEELQKDGLVVEVRETAGSVENLRLLSEDGSGVAVAIVQSGVATPAEIQKCYALGSLYHEPLWVFYRGDKQVERIGQLAGKRIGVGPTGSGTHAIATAVACGQRPDRIPVLPGRFTSRARRGKRRSARPRPCRRESWMPHSSSRPFEADYIQGLLNDRSVNLLSFDQHEAYHRRFRFLAPVTVPAGLVNLGQNIPGQDIALLAPTAMLVVRKDFHPALVPLLLTTATRIHGQGDELSASRRVPVRSRIATSP